jgi:arylsulfatase
LAGAEIPANRRIDGKSMLPILFGTGAGERQFIHYYIDGKLTAIRKGPWKAHFLTQVEFGGKIRELHDPPLLFNLEEDPSERHEVAKEHPEIVNDLVLEAEKHKREVRPGKPQT